MMIGINDPWNLKESNILKFFNGNILKRLSLKIELLLSNIRIFQFLKLAYLSNKEIELVSFNNKTRSEGFVYTQDNSERSRALYDAINYNISKIKLIAENNNVNILFMKYHNIGWGNPERIIHQIYSKLNVQVVDNEIIFYQAKKMNMDVKASDNFHPNDSGYMLIAKNVYNKMITLGLVTAEPIKIFE